MPRFWKRRFLRLAPVFYLACALNLIFRLGMGPEPTWVRILENLTFTFGAIHPNHALVTGGDAGKAGIMTMTDDRWKQTASFMASAKLLKASTDYRRAYTLDLVKEVKVLP